MPKLTWIAVQGKNHRELLEQNCGLCEQAFAEGDEHWLPDSPPEYLSELITRAILPVAPMDF